MFSLFFLLLSFWGIPWDAIAQEETYSSDVHISEFVPRPLEGGTVGEFIEVHNASEVSQDISGWVLDDIENGGSNPFTISPNTILLAGDYLAFYTTSPHVALNDSGDHVRLIRPDGVVQDDIVYSTSEVGYSYNRLENGSYVQSSFITPNEPNVFSESPTPVPSPSPTVTPSPTSTPKISYSEHIHINEFLPNPKGDDAVGEFIELSNTGSDDVDISEWVIDDVADSGSAPFSIPDETSIPGNGFVTFFRSVTKISLNNDNDHVRLVRPDGILQKDVAYTNTTEAHSHNRIDAEKYEKSSTITPNAANIITSISAPTPRPKADEDTEKESEFSYDFSIKIVVNEFLPNPKGDDAVGEFIEIKSQDKRNINLLGWKLDDSDGGSAPYLFTKEDSIGPGKIIVLFRKKSKIALNNDTDSVRLIDPNGKYISRVAYDGKIIEGQSYGRDADGLFMWTDIPTPGSENIISIQEKITPMPKLRAAKKVSAVKKQSSPRVLSVINPVSSTLPWLDIYQEEGAVSRSVHGDERISKSLNRKQIIFILFGVTIACMQLLSGISHKEPIWQK